MRSPRLLACALLVLAPVALVGCWRSTVSYAKIVTVEGGDAFQAQTIDAPIREQKVTVTVSGATAPVNVYVVLEKDREAAQDSLRLQKPPANALARAENVQDATLEATVPAKTSYTVLLAPVGGKTARAELKINGR